MISLGSVFDFGEAKLSSRDMIFYRESDLKVCIIASAVPALLP